jgi:hypothetical protein
LLLSSGGVRIRDVAGSYAMSYTISACMLLVAAVLAFVIRPPADKAGSGR